MDIPFRATTIYSSTIASSSGYATSTLSGEDLVLLYDSIMTYKGKLKSGEELLVQNDGEQTHIEVRSGDSTSHSSQSSGFDAGKWKGTPKLWAMEDGAVLQIETEQNSEFYKIVEHGIQHLEAAPDLQEAKPLELVESDETVSEVSLEQMPPMKPLEMKPLEPLKPMK